MTQAGEGKEEEEEPTQTTVDPQTTVLSCLLTVSLFVGYFTESELAHLAHRISAHESEYKLAEVVWEATGHEPSMHTFPQKSCFRGWTLWSSSVVKGKDEGGNVHCSLT